MARDLWSNRGGMLFFTVAGGDRIRLYCLHSQFMTLLNVSHDSCWCLTSVCPPYSDYNLPLHPPLYPQTHGVMMRSDSSVSLWVTCWKHKRAQTSEKIGRGRRTGWLKRLCPSSFEWGEPQGWSRALTSPLSTLSSFFSFKCSLYFNWWSRRAKEKKARSRTAASVKKDLSLVLVQQLQCMSGCVLFDTKCLSDTQTHFFLGGVALPHVLFHGKVTNVSRADMPWSLKLYQMLTSLCHSKQLRHWASKVDDCEKHPGLC